MEPQIIRPSIDRENERWQELERYLLDHWERAKTGRSTQVEEDWNRWTKNYQAIPREKRRTLPWPGASNLVIPLIRIYIDTFVARTLNVIFSTRPLLTAEGFPSEDKEALQKYLDDKATYEWGLYQLGRDLLQAGNKNGTTVAKVPWVSEKAVEVVSEGGQVVEKPFTRFEGPKAEVISFDDFYFYPVTTPIPKAKIKFHRLRLVEEEARRKVAGSLWQLSDEELTTALESPNDVKRLSENEEAGVADNYLRELKLVECHLDWELQGGKYYSVIALICPAISRMVDLYYHPYPGSPDIFHAYTPFPREDCGYGESMAQMLEAMQEEVSTIHNDRRNNSYIANAPVFKRRNGANIPNPSTNWYPGKVFDLEDIQDFDALTVGRNYANTLDEENYVFTIAERLSGIGPVMQGYAQGFMGKRGIYNAQGTMALLSESNQRQDTNIKDVREVIGAIGRTSLLLQAAFGKDDPRIEDYPEEMQAQILRALEWSKPERVMRTKLTVKASNSGANKEVSRQNAMQMGSILSQYGQMVQQMAPMLLDQKVNPGLRLILNDTIKMHSWMAKKLLRHFDEFDAEGVLPNVPAAIETIVPGGSRGTKELSESAEELPMVPPGGAGAGGSLGPEQLQAFAAMAGAPLPGAGTVGG